MLDWGSGTGDPVPDWGSGTGDPVPDWSSGDLIAEEPVVAAARVLLALSA